jgi:hypothetical protein
VIGAAERDHISLISLRSNQATLAGNCFGIAVAEGNISLENLATVPEDQDLGQGGIAIDFRLGGISCSAPAGFTTKH